MNDSIVIVGGGPSLKKFDFDKLKNIDTICVNQAAFDVPNSNYLITCDYTFINKIGRNKINRLKGSCKKVFVVNLYGEEIEVRRNNPISNRYIDVRCNIVYDLRGFEQIIEANGLEGLGFGFDDFCSGSNSGYCGFQLAVILGYENIYLLGFDLQFSGNITHYHTKYSAPMKKFKERLERYYNTFETSFELLAEHRPSVKVFNCSVDSRLKNLIPTIDLSKVFDKKVI